MPLGNKERRVFLSLAHGKIVLRQKDGNVQEFTYLEGLFTGIERRQGEINGSATEFLNFNFDDGADKYSLSVIADSNVAQGLVRSLYGIEDFSKPVRIEAFARAKDGKEYTNTAVYSGGNKAQWAFDLPAPEVKHTADGEVFTSYKKRAEKIAEAVDAINARVENNRSDAAFNEPAPAESADPAFDEGFYQAEPDYGFEGGTPSY